MDASAGWGDSSESNSADWGWGNESASCNKEETLLYRELPLDPFFTPKCLNKDAVHLEQALRLSGAHILFSSPESWERFLNDQPDAIAVLSQGIEKDSNMMPLMVVIASPRYVIIEFPSDKEGYREEREGILPGDTYAGEKQIPSAFTSYLTAVLTNSAILKVLFSIPKFELAPALKAICNNFTEVTSLLDQSGLDLGGRFANSFNVAEMLSIIKGSVYERRSHRKEGWNAALMRSTRAIKNERLYIVSCAADCWSIISAYSALTSITRLRDLPPPSPSFSPR